MFNNLKKKRTLRQLSIEIYFNLHVTNCLQDYNEVKKERIFKLVKHLTERITNKYE